jgi:hypothetical protein
MATDFLVLGGIVFDEWSTPERMPFGGAHAMAVHQLPGGSRVVDTLGPIEADIRFTGLMYDNNAIGVAETLDALRLNGTQVRSFSRAGSTWCWSVTSGWTSGASHNWSSTM